jgi:hypothetical protein
MRTENTRIVRRRIMAILYESYQKDPNQMLTPADLLADGSIPKEKLAANSYYLHDRGFIELLVGYNPPLFAAARIAPKGIDLVEDSDEFERVFALSPVAERSLTREVIPLLLQLAQQAEGVPGNGLVSQWLRDDVTRLRDELRRPQEDWDSDRILNALQWLEGSVADAPERLPALNALRTVILDRYA